MNKYIFIILVLVIFTLPRVTFAFWYKPTTWFNNWSFKKELKTEINDDKFFLLEQKILELEEKIKQADNNIASSSQIKAEEIKPTIIKKEQLQPKIVPVVPTQPSVNKTDIVNNTNTLKEDRVSLEIIGLRQTIFKETDNSYGYGGFEVVLRITSNTNLDVFVPMTTSDSTEGITGLYYSTKGDYFRGDQSSKISCSLKTGNYCKIKANNYSDITATVWLTPNESGNYSVEFEKVKVLLGSQSGENVELKINKTTEKIYLKQ